MKRFFNAIFLFCLTLAFWTASPGLHAASRFPRPEFNETNHQYPENFHPTPRSLTWEYVDVAVLFLALCLASYLALKKRSRKGLAALAVFSVFYFGFFRQGCVCSVGSFQNMAEGFFSAAGPIPVVVLGFFFLPLLFSLFFGRVFCASVCPLGAVQELVLAKPVQIPGWLDRPLRFIPYIYLTLALVLAVTGTGYIVCRYDPFIPIFRASGSINILMIAGVFLILSFFIGRPYCRYLCPYAVFLNWTSRLSWKHVTITPDECIHCHLCENSCPYGAIKTPVQKRMGSERGRERMMLGILILVLPVLVIGGAWLGRMSTGAVSRLNTQVQIADALILDMQIEEGERLSGDEQDLVDGFKQTARPAAEFFEETDKLRERFSMASGLGGGFIGLILGLSLIRLTLRRRQDDYIPDNGICVSCGRCFKYCPKEHLRLKEKYGEKNE